MSNQDFDLDEAGPPIDFTSRRAQALVATSVDADPEKAVRANLIAQNLGVDPGAVHENLDQFEEQYKNTLSSALVANNRHLQAYVNDHPLAAKVSNDDYGQLDSVSNTLSKFANNSVIKATIKGFVDNANLENLSAEHDKLALMLASNPVFSNAFVRHAVEAAGTTLAGTMALASGVIGGAATGVAELYKQVGGNEAEANRLTRDLITFAQVGLSGQAGLHGFVHPKVHTMVAEAARVSKAIEPYVTAGKEPPVGLHTVIDELKAEQAKVDVDNLSEALKESTNSATRERSPDLFSSYISKITDGEIGISADAVRKLYGDKLPTPDDGLLGWVPRLQEQLAAAEATGGDVKIKVADWLARVEPEVAKELKDHIRARSEGMTVEESKLYDSVQQVNDLSAQQRALQDQMRDIGLRANEAQDHGDNATRDRLFEEQDVLKKRYRELEKQIGDNVQQTATSTRQFAGLQGPVRDRKISLKPIEERLGFEKPGNEARHGFSILDDQGKAIADLFVTEEKDGKRLFVDDIRGLNEYGLLENQSNKLGYRAMREVTEQLTEKFPNAETLEGMRVSGAREKANKENVRAGIDLNKIRERMAARSKFPEEPKPGLDVMRMEDREAFAKASAIGMTVDQYKRYQTLIERRAKEDSEAANARAIADQRKRQTVEWKSNRAELRPRVAEEVAARPEVELDELLREGKVKLSREGLTDDQILLLSKDFITKDGIHLDDLSGLFGDVAPRALVDRLIALNQAREQSGMKPKQFLQRTIDAETDRQMEAKYGSLDHNILEEAKDQVLSETQEELLHEETLARAQEAGLEFSINKDEYKAALKGFFDRQLVRDVSSDVGLSESGRAGRATELALLKGDYSEAFRQKQRQYNAIVMANYAKKFEKAQERFEKLADRYKARELPAVDQEYTNWVRDILLRTEKLDPRQATDLIGLIERSDSGIKSLSEFVEYKEHHDLREVPVAEFLTDPNFRKAYEDLTAAEAQEVHDSVRALDKNGRDEKKFIRAGEAHDLQELKNQLVESLQRFKEKEYDTEGKRDQFAAGVRGAIRTAIVAHLQVEAVFNRLDRFDTKGPWNQFVFRPLVEAANHEAVLEREFSKRLGAIADNVNLKEVIPVSIFTSPFKGAVGLEPPMRMTRKNLRAVLLNAGNDSNLWKMAKGYGLEPAEVKGWLDTYATKQDWDWAQKMWDMLKELGERSDTMYRGLTGVAPAKIEIKGVDTPHGRYEGGYYPLIRHELYGEDIKLAKTDLEGQGYIRATTAAGYTKKRTGAIYPLSLDLDALPNQIKQIIHDTSFRPAIIQAGKIFYDNKIKNEFKKHLGAEYSDMFVPWLKDVANTQNYYASKATKQFMAFSDFMRQNAITTLVGFNIGTVMKHTPTAIASSMAEVGPRNLLKAAQSLLTVNEETGNNNWQFAIKTSEELQRRSRNWVETMGGGMKVLEGRTIGKALAQHEYGAAAMNLRDVITEVASKPVAMGDLISAVPTWMARYTMEMQDHGVHGDAVYAADKAVRQAHGSSAITSKSAVARSRSLSWFTGFFTFFNDLFNRQVETIWRAGEALDLTKKGEHTEAMGQATKVAGRLFAYVIVPAMIEELVTPLMSDKKESWGSTAAKALTFTLSSSYVFVREIVNAMLNGRDPSVGLLSTSEKAITDMARDLSAKKPKPGNIIKHGTMLTGMLTGMTPAPIGKAAEFALSKEKPKGPWGWMVGLRYGTLDNHSKTFDQWMKGH